MNQPPHNLEAEQRILGMMMQRHESVAQAVTVLSSGEFYKPAHSEIFDSCCRLFMAGESVDIVTVANDLQSVGKVELLPYLAGLTDMIPFAGIIDRYAPIVKEKAVARNTIALAAKMMERCYRDEPMKCIAEDFGKEFFDIVADKTKGARGIAAIVNEVQAEIKDVHENGVQLGMPTGYFDLDDRWNGMQRGDMIVLAARPSMGKTALAMNIATNCASAGHKVLVFSLEMKDRGLVQRIISSVSHVSGNAIRKGNLPDSQFDHVMRSGDKVAKLPMMIDETSGLNIIELIARAKMVALKSGVNLIVIDYIQLMCAKAENRTQEVSAISRGLKGLAKELNIPVIALSQLSRGVESRTDKRPMLSDLRESGAIEQDADVIAFIYRDDYYNKDPENPHKGISEIITAKQRNGPTGVDKMVFQGEFSQFSSMTKRREEVYP